MKRWFKRLGLAACAFLLLAQFISLRPDETPVDAKLALAAPPAVSAVLQASCYDCHSNQTRWPWYEHIAPVSWFIQNHVAEGRRRLNFSIWNTYDSGRMINKLNAMRDAVKSHWMPLSSYLWIHRGAVLSPEKAKTVTAWADATARQLAAQTVDAATPAASSVAPAPTH